MRRPLCVVTMPASSAVWYIPFVGVSKQIEVAHHRLLVLGDVCEVADQARREMPALYLYHGKLELALQSIEVDLPAGRRRAPCALSPPGSPECIEHGACSASRRQRRRRSTPVTSSPSLTINQLLATADGADNH